MISGSVTRIGFLLLALTVSVAASDGTADPSLLGASDHRSERGFRNTNPAFTPPRTWGRILFIGSRILATTFHPRSAHFSLEENDGSFLRANRTEATVTWVGHSTLLIQLDGLNILTDPHWSDRASPISFAGPKRVTPPGIRFEDLPPIDLVLISHNHYDHLDTATIKRLGAIHHPLFLVPLGLKAWFSSLGIMEVEELDWWDSRNIRGLTFTCLPAQHFSGRTLWDRNDTLWSSWAVIGHEKRLFFAGDTGYYDAFKEIGDRLGPFDLAAIAIGAYMPRAIMKMTHTTPEEALKLFGDLKGERFLGIHWGTFDLTEEPIEEPPHRLAAEAKRLGLDPERVWVFKHGETRRW